VRCLQTNLPLEYLLSRRCKRTTKRCKSELYNILYSLNWGDAAFNNYGFAPAETFGPERFQLQLYGELAKLLRGAGLRSTAKNMLEISCGRGGGLYHMINILGVESQAIGLDFSINAIRHCSRHYVDCAKLSFVCGDALRLPFADSSFDIVVNVEASHVYGDDTSFFREISRVLAGNGAFLYADYRRRDCMPALQQLARDTSLTGTFHDITANIAAACELDAQRRLALIRAGVPWYYRILANQRLKGYAAIPGTPNFERFRGGDRMYFMTCLTRLR
jgi:ubiquinone/menaquinone biosynthesis C-methylase UbiE